MNSALKRNLIVLLTVAAVLLLPLAAQATTAFFDLGTPNTALSNFSGPYATITITGGATDTVAGPVSFEVVGLTGTYNPTNTPVQYLLGGNDIFGIMGLTITAVTDYSQTGMTGFSAPSFSYPGAGNVDGFGSGNDPFTSTIRNFDGFSNAVLSFSFDVSQTFDDAAAALAFLQTNVNTKGFFAAAHIFPTITEGGINRANGVLTATGYAGDGSQGVLVPVPPTAWLMGFGLLGLGLLGWRRKNG